jgi:hypothetical protein
MLRLLPALLLTVGAALPVAAQSAASINTTTPPRFFASDCTQTKPRLINDPAYAGFARVAVMTAAGHDFANPALDPSVTVFNLGATPCAAPAGAYCTTTSSPLKFTRPDWSRQTLGTVFGMTLDQAGNIYVGHTSIYFNFLTQFGSVTSGCAGPAVNSGGTVYKINGNTGVPCVLTSLPNVGVAGVAPGLGNMCYDPVVAQLYITNFEDGRIYRVDAATGAILSTYSHCAGVVLAGGAADPNDIPGQAASFGCLTWGVKQNAGRLYYGVWSQDMANPSGPPNTVWSIALGPSGDFVPGSAQLEITPPQLAGQGMNMPISDISFSADCRMLIAERTMSGMFNSSAHLSRVMEYQRTVTGWALTTSNTNVEPAFSVTSPAGGLPIGVHFMHANAAGGVDYDHSVLTPAAPCNRGIYATADALLFSNSTIYGFAGLLRSGAGVPQSSPPDNFATTAMWDYNGNVAFGDKMKQGDISVPCASGCVAVVSQSVRCTGPGTAVWTVTFQNNGSSPITNVSYASTAGPVSPASQAVTVAPGGTWSVSLTLSGYPAGGVFPVRVSVGAAQGEVVCAIQKCVQVPRCNCVDWTTTSVTCLPNGQVQVSGTLTNLFGPALQALQIVGLPSGVSASPSLTAIPPLAFGATAPFTFTLSGAPPGGQVCFSLIAKTSLELGEQCEVPICVVIPRCEGQGGNAGPWTAAITQVAHCCRPPFTTNASLALTICNNGSAVQQFTWSIAGAIPSATCPIPLNPSNFAPNAGGPISLNPGQCIAVPISVLCGQVSPVAGSSGCYVATVNNLTSFTSQQTSGQLFRNAIPRMCWRIIDIGNVNLPPPVLRMGTPGPVISLPVGYDGETPKLFAYQLQAGPRVSLNGLPPGTPINGLMTLIPSGNNAIQVAASAPDLGSAAGSLESLLVIGDLDGDGTLDEPMASLELRVMPPAGRRYTVFADDFDLRPQGDVCDGFNWSTWLNGDDVCGEVLPDIGTDTSQALRISGSPGNPAGHGDDTVLRLRIDSTPARISTNFTVRQSSRGVGYMILLDRYPDPLRFGLQLQIDATAGVIRNLDNPAEQLPLVRDRSAPLQIDIDFQADTVTVTYDGAVLIAGRSWRNGVPNQTVPSSGGLAAIDFYGGEPTPVGQQPVGITSMVIDDLVVSTLSVEGTSVTPPSCPGDIVSVGGLPPPDGLITGDDFNAFINAFAAGDLLADVVAVGGIPPGDGLLTGDDFIAFINSFAAGCP